MCTVGTSHGDPAERALDRATKGPDRQDYGFAADDPTLRDVTFQTSQVGDRLYGRLRGTVTESCIFSAEDDNKPPTAVHVIPVNTDWVDLETVAPFGAAVRELAETRRTVAKTLVYQVRANWRHECEYKTRAEVREVERARAQAANAKPGTSIYGRQMTPVLETMEATARQDAELAGLAIRFASVSGILGFCPGSRLATRFYTTCGFRPQEWDQLVTSLIVGARGDMWTAMAIAFGADALGTTVADYRAVFEPALAAYLNVTRGELVAAPAWLDQAAIAPWLGLLAAMEQAARPGLLGKLFGRSRA